MKKTLILAAAMALFFASAGFCKKVPEPETAPAVTFDGAAYTTVLDVVTLKKFDDRIRVISAIDENKNFHVHIYRAKKAAWESFGIANLSGFGDTDFIDAEDEAGKCRWVAITPLGGGDYKYSIRGSGTDLYITVLPNKDPISPSLKSKATIFDIATVEGVFKDDVEVVNTTSNNAASFSVYAFNDESEPWIKLGDAIFSNGSGNKKIIYAPYDFSAATFKFYAIVSKDGKEYNYSAVAIKKNLIITAN